MIASDAGLFTSVVGSVSVEELHFVPEAEVFTSDGLLEIDVDDVRFESGQEFVQLESGTLLIEEITNEMGMDMEMLQFSLPGFRVAPYGSADSLVIRFSGSGNDPQNLQFSQLSGQTTLRNIPIDLSGVRIYPVDNEARYNVFAVSKAGVPTVLNVADRIVASIAPQNLNVATVHAIMNPTVVELSDDVDGDGRFELMNDLEAEVMDLGSLDALSEYNMEEFQFNGTQFTFSIETNLGADIVFYAAMMGIKEDGTRVFLRGTGDFAVPPGDTLASAFTLDGAPIDPDNLIRFVIPGAPDAGRPVTQVITLNGTNTNLDAFISALPQEFRYVSKGLVMGTGGGDVVQLQKPFTMSASIGAGIPLSFTGAFSIDETIEADFSSLEDLTDPEAEAVINEGALTLEYTNGLPVGIDLQVEVLDAAGAVVLSLPAEGAEPYALEPADADAAGLATAGTTGTLEIAVTEDDLRAMSRGHEARINLRVNTNQDTPATLRATDTIGFQLLGRFDLTVQVQE